VSKFKAGLVAVGAVAAMAMFAPAAQAAPCDGEGLEQPFLDWNDDSFYGLAPGGDFESGLDGWQVTGDSALAPGGNPFRESSSATALQLSDGDSATTPPICVTKDSPNGRLFAQTVDAGDKNNSLAVEVLYLNEDGSVDKVKKSGKFTNTSEWDATRKFSLAPGQFGDGDSYIQLRLTPRAGATWKVDDIFIDPRRYS
jgi:hypothetical protein